MKNKIENALMISQFVAFMVATILALAFEFSGLEMLLICALVLYVVAFGLMTINGCIYLNGRYKVLKTILSAPKTADNTTDSADTKAADSTTDSADTKADNSVINVAQTIETDKTGSIKNAAANAENVTAVETCESGEYELSNNKKSNAVLDGTTDDVTDDAADDDANDEAAIKKQIVLGLVKVSLCAIFCLFSFVCLVLF